MARSKMTTRTSSHTRFRANTEDTKRFLANITLEKAVSAGVNPDLRVASNTPLQSFPLPFQHQFFRTYPLFPDDINVANRIDVALIYFSLINLCADVI